MGTQMRFREDTFLGSSLPGNSFSPDDTSLSPDDTLLSLDDTPLSPEGTFFSERRFVFDTELGVNSEIWYFLDRVELIRLLLIMNYLRYSNLIQLYSETILLSRIHYLSRVWCH